MQVTGISSTILDSGFSHVLIDSVRAIRTRERVKSLTALNVHRHHIGYRVMDYT